jgi:5,10-methylenetetrahydromethanopterin reductase
VLSVYHDLFYPPSIVPLVAMARVSERVRLGPAALNASTLHPYEIAGQIAALDGASDGRAYLGLVTGSWLDQLELDDAKPLTRLREAVEIVRRLLARDTSGFAGERFTLAPGAALTYAPLRPSVPLMIGTWRPRGAAYAATVADEVKIGGSANPDLVRQMRAWLGAEGPRIVVGAVTVVHEDGGAARARAAREVELYLDVVGSLDPTLGLKPGETAPLEKFTLAGTPVDVAAQARELLDAGAHRVEFGTPQGSLDLLCDRVLPELRR